MKLIDADLLRDIMYEYVTKLKKEDKELYYRYFEKELELVRTITDAVRAATVPELRIIQADYGDWILCSERLPEVGANVILTFRDTFHTHDSWPKITVMPAWICNVDEDSPKGMWAIEGRLGDYIIDIESGIAWMPMPEAYKEKER